MVILTRRSYSHTPYFIFLPGYLVSEECLTHSSHSEKKKKRNPKRGKTKIIWLEENVGSDGDSRKAC